MSGLIHCQNQGLREEEDGEEKADPRERARAWVGGVLGAEEPRLGPECLGESRLLGFCAHTATSGLTLSKGL